MIHKRIADFPLDSDLGFIVFLVLVLMQPHLYREEFASHFISYFPTVESSIARNYSKPTDAMDYRDHPLLKEFFTDPVRAGKYVLDGPKYALVARFLLDCFIQPYSERKFLEQVVLFSNVFKGILT